MKIPKPNQSISAKKNQLHKTLNCSINKSSAHRTVRKVFGNLFIIPAPQTLRIQTLFPKLLLLLLLGNFLLCSCRKDTTVAPSIQWINPGKDVSINNSGSLRVEVQISDNNDQFQTLLSLSDENGNVLFSKGQFSSENSSIIVSETIPTSALSQGSYQLSLLATDRDENKIRSTLRISLLDSGAQTLLEGFISLHQNGSQAYAAFHLNNNTVSSSPFLSDNAMICANPTTATLLMTPRGPGDARCLEPASANMLWSWPGTSGPLGGFTCCSFSEPLFLIGEKTGYIRKFNSSGLAQGSCPYFPGSYYPSEIFTFQNSILSVQKAVTSANPDKIVVFNAISGQGMQEINLPFRVEDALQQQDTLYLLTQSNPRQIWRYLTSFNSYELVDNTNLTTSLAFLSPGTNTTFLLTTDQGIYEVKPSSNYTYLIFAESGLSCAAKKSSNPNHVVFLKNNSLKIIHRSTQNLVSEINLDAGATDFLILSP